MRRPTTWVLLAAALAACGSVNERGACGASTDCPIGQYCAHTADGGVCWADAVPPRVSGVAVTCLDPVAVGSACPRDGVLHVEATITDDREVLGADAVLDVGGAPVPLARAGGDLWVADVALAGHPFDHFEHAVVTTVVARDGARNETAVAPPAANAVTRRLWTASLGTPLVTPSVDGSGLLAIPTNSGKIHFASWDGQFLGSVELATNTVQAVTAPIALNDSIWVGAEDGNVYEIAAHTGGGWTSTARANTGGAIRGSLAATSGGTIVAASESGIVYAVTSASYRNGGTVGLPISIGPVIDEQGGIFAAASGSVRRLTLQSGIPTDSWGAAVSLGGTTVDPLACTTNLFAAGTSGAQGVITAVTTQSSATVLATMEPPSGGVTILSDGSILVPEQTKTISRWTTSGAAFPGWQKPDLGGAPRTPLVLAAADPFVVPTAKGTVYALRPDGTVAWSGQLSAGTAALQPGNIYTPPGQPAGAEVSTAYFAGSDGVLHAVLVDGTLDASAPWPKAFHDPRNTNRAGAQP